MGPGSDLGGHLEARRLSLEKRLNLRLKIQVKARVVAQLIGSSVKHEFMSDNISSAGLLLQHDPSVPHAFNHHSILEVWIDDDHSQSIYFLAKYIRKASENSFAIRIVDVDSKNEKLLAAFLNRLQNPDL